MEKSTAGESMVWSHVLRFGSVPKDSNEIEWESRELVSSPAILTDMNGTTVTGTDLKAFAEQSTAWPFEEARKIMARLKRQAPKASEQEVVFETGYGPSGLPHIGTFGEVARTTMVRHAFRTLTDDTVK